ncbi:MAG: alpha-glucan family phosphorylase [Calditrichaeota bacterium]|nr:MAG: alpha-glucan family phosphorylase [Calditrichota bacterium]
MKPTPYSRPNTHIPANNLPAKLSNLTNLAYNLWWTWTPQIQDLFATIDETAWNEHHNPVKIVRKTSAARFDALVKDAEFMGAYKKACSMLDKELSRSTWLDKKYSQYSDKLIVYLCAEFGLHESLPIYSGGLGILAGDHTKSASDIGLPFIGVGLLYRNGYFKQEIDKTGKQISVYPKHDFSDLAVQEIVDSAGKPITVSVDLPDGPVKIKAWLCDVGRSVLLLLDTDFEGNSKKSRTITHQLYGGDREMRISQEIVLGIGGVRLLKKLGIDPDAWHMNEGHVAFSLFERTKNIMIEHELAFEEAAEVVTAATVFTTHTPVPAGNEAFSLPLVDKYFRTYTKELGIRTTDLLHLGLLENEDGDKYFSMTILALRLSCKANGVSKLHGLVSQKMWSHLWENVPATENPITSITNGIHAQTWIAPEISELYDRQLNGDWRKNLNNKKFWQQIKNIPDAELEKTSQVQKQRFIDFVRTRLKQQFTRNKLNKKLIASVDNWLDPDTLTIGFARRFATYKRATLIFSDLKRLEKLICNPKKPVQFIFAGKAHPADKDGQALIKRIWEVSQMPVFQGKIVILENYDMELGRQLVQGVDIWLNNPRRPQEASGTSGQKVPINGGLNFSILDGWWPEAFDGTNGWEIGTEAEYEDLKMQDADDAASLYEKFEKDIVPLYYGNKNGRTKWFAAVKSSIATVTPVFNTEAMVCNYFEKLYKYAIDRNKKTNEPDFAIARDLSVFKEILYENWPLLHCTSVDYAVKKNQLTVSAELYLGELEPEDIEVQLLYLYTKNGQELKEKFTLEPSKGKGSFTSSYKLEEKIPSHLRKVQPQLRVVAKHEETGQKIELGLMYIKDIG